jgi:uncharacterized protein (TIGR02611 family)
MEATFKDLQRRSGSAGPDGKRTGGANVSELARGARRIAVLVAGLALLAVGAVMLVLPGPGILVCMAGLALLATEFAWARRLLARAREHARRISSQVRRR